MEKYIKNILIKKISIFFNLDLENNFSLTPIYGGRNNILYLFNHKKLNLIIKNYPSKKTLNFKREKMFYEYLVKKKIKNSPKYLFSIKNKLSVFTHIKGNKIKKIKKNNIIDSLKFIEKINSNKITTNFPLASDGCTNIYDHIKIVSKRIDNFNMLVDKCYQNKKIYFFFKRRIIPRFNYEKKLILQNFEKNLKNRFKQNELILSPSDFGFHNMIIKRNIVYYLDFEYSGIDDASKLFCDYICQPDLQLNERHIDLLLRRINIKNKDNYKITKRIKVLLNIHRIKWCMVILNVFLADKNLKFKSKSYLKNLQNYQLKKSIKYFNKYL